MSDIDDKNSSKQSKKPTSKQKQPKNVKPKLTLKEKQAIKLKIQKERQAKKIAAGEIEPKNKERFYCTSAELQAELIKWRDSNLEEEAAELKAWKALPKAERDAHPYEIDYTKRKISDELCRMWMAIADKLLNRSEFRNYSKELKEDAKSYFLLKAIKGLPNYNFEFNNPFAYFTTAAWNAYISVIGKYYKHQNIKLDYMKQRLAELESYHGIDPKSSLKNYLTQYIDGMAQDGITGLDD